MRKIFLSRIKIQFTVHISRYLSHKFNQPLTRKPLSLVISECLLQYPACADFFLDIIPLTIQHKYHLHIVHIVLGLISNL